MGENDKEITENGEALEGENEEKPQEAVTAAPESAETAEKKRGAIPWKKILISSCITAAVLAAAYLGGAAYYKSHFFFNTGIGGVDCSNLTAEAAKEKLENEINNYTFTFYEKNGEEEVIKGEEIHLTHSPIENMEELLSKQNPFAWVTASKSRDLPLNVEISYSNDALYNRITQMKFSERTRKNMEGSVDNIYYENGVYGVRDDGTKDIVSVNDMYKKVKPKIKDLYRGMSMEKRTAIRVLPMTT